jgi:hypothetical protein
MLTPPSIVCRALSSVHEYSGMVSSLSRIIQRSPLQIKEFLQGGNIESFLVLVVGVQL